MRWFSVGQIYQDHILNLHCLKIQCPWTGPIHPWPAGCTSQTWPGGMSLQRYNKIYWEVLHSFDTVILKPPEDDTWQVANTHLQSWWVPRRHVCLCGKRHWSPGKEQMGAFAAFLPHTLPLTLPGGSITAHNKHPVFGSEAQEVSVYCCSACVSGPPHHVGKPKAGMRL